MKTNEELQQDVEDAIKWEPLLKAAEIGVTAQDGVVTLMGSVDSYAKKSEAEDAVKTVAGVRAVVEKIVVDFGNAMAPSDTDVANKIVSAFDRSLNVPDDKVKVKVEKGWVTLEGELKWNYEKEAANRAVRNLAGVMGVTNHITIKSETHDAIEKKGIERALSRNWSISAENIQVGVSGSDVTLNGTVDSLYERDEAERVARNAPGVWTVDNELLIDSNR